MENRTYIQWKRQISEIAKKKGTPILAEFELTGRCNLDCKMCYVHTLDHCAAREKELTTEQWKNIFNDAYNQGMLFATLTGGECLLRSDFRELYLYLWKKRVFIDILSNGTMLDSEYIEFFKTYPPAGFQISLYGSSEEGYLNVTGHKGFEKTVAAIRSLMDAGIDVRVAVTPSVYMRDDYIQILKFCRENGIPASHSDMVLAANRENPDKNDYYLSVDEIVELSVQRAALYKELQPREEIPEAGGNKLNARKGLSCNAGNCLAHITWDGKMHPCVSAIQKEGSDVRELGFAEAWERTKAMAAATLLPAECEGCAYQKVCIRCPMLRSPKQDGHCDPAICKMTKHLVAAGVKKLEA